MIAIGMLVLIIGVAAAVVLIGRSDRARSAARRTHSDPRAETFLSTEPTLYAVPDEPIAGTDAAAAGVVPPDRSVPLYAEALGYIGGVLVMVALGVIVQEYWSDLGVAGRLALSAGGPAGSVDAGWNPVPPPLPTPCGPPTEFPKAGASSPLQTSIPARKAACASAPSEPTTNPPGSGPIRVPDVPVIRNRHPTNR